MAQYTLAQHVGGNHEYQKQLYTSLPQADSDGFGLMLFIMHTDYCIGVVCPSNGTCVSNPTSYTCEQAHQEQSGESRSSVPGAVIGAIVAGLLVALLLCAVVVIVIIVCIVLRKKRWPRKEILHTPTQPARANTAPRGDDVRLMQNPAYPVHTHIVHSSQRELEQLRQLEGDNSHNTPSSQTNHSTLQDPRSSMATGANGELGQDGAIHLLSNPAYGTRNENPPRRRESPPGPAVSSSQGNTAVPHNTEYIQLLPDTANNTAAERTLQHPLQPHEEGEGSQNGPQPRTSPPAREPQGNEAVYYYI